MSRSRALGHVVVPSTSIPSSCTGSPVAALTASTAAGVIRTDVAVTGDYAARLGQERDQVRREEVLASPRPITIGV
jgi:hypothetical protein